MNNDVEEFFSQEADLHERARNATVRLLKQKAYEIKEIGWSCTAGNVDIIAKDKDGTIVFANVSINDGKIDEGFPEDKLSRKERIQLEIVAANYLSEQDDVGVSVRFDTISLIVLGPGKAFLKHHINACV